MCVLEFHVISSKGIHFWESMFTKMEGTKNAIYATLAP